MREVANPAQPGARADGGPPLLTIVCPVFNEEKTIEPFYRRISPVMEALSDRVTCELLFVNNRSGDGTLDAILHLRAADPRIKVLTFSRNFGYQASISAGMKHALGDCIVNIDVDCEDPPELIPAFVDAWLAGADIVYGSRDKREEFVLMHLARKLFYRVTRRIADHEIVLDMAEFLLIDKRCRDSVLAFRSTYPFVRGQVGYVGFKRVGIPYRRQRRIVGESHYNLLGAIRFGAAGILTSSTMVLRLLAYVGIALIFADTALAGLALHGAGMTLSPVERLMVCAVLLQIGWLALAIGTVGLYLARVYKDNLGMPLYVVDERLSFYA